MLRVAQPSTKRVLVVTQHRARVNKMRQDKTPPPPPPPTAHRRHRPWPLVLSPPRDSALFCVCGVCVSGHGVGVGRAGTAKAHKGAPITNTECFWHARVTAYTLLKSEVSLRAFQPYARGAARPDSRLLGVRRGLSSLSISTRQAPPEKKLVVPLSNICPQVQKASLARRVVFQICTEPACSARFHYPYFRTDFGFGVDPGRLRGYPLAHLAGTWRLPTPHHPDAVPTDFNGFMWLSRPPPKSRDSGTGHLRHQNAAPTPHSRHAPHPPRLVCGGNYGAGTH
jgi:hypothetical protein